MKRRWLIILVGILGLLMIYEISRNDFAVFMLIVGTGSLLFSKRVPVKNQNRLLFIGVSALFLALFSSRLALAFVAVGVLLLIGKNPELFQLIREVLTNRRDIKNRNDFIMVDFNQLEQSPLQISRNRWLGDDRETEEGIYSWEDVNFTKLFGDTIFDLGNTLLPKENNVILIRKGMGNTKILVPEGIAISLNISMLAGKLWVGKEAIELKNETVHWYSNSYLQNERKIKLVVNVLLGEVEVVFL